MNEAQETTRKATSELLPCPFCGSTDLRFEGGGNFGMVECQSCAGSSGTVIIDRDERDRALEIYAEQWNRRAAAPAGSSPYSGMLGDRGEADEGIVIHCRGAENLSDEERNAIAEMVRAAVAAAREGTLPNEAT